MLRTHAALVAALVLSLEREGVVCLYREDQERDDHGRFAPEGAGGGGASAEPGGAARRRSDPAAAERAARAIARGSSATFADLERALGRPPTGRERSIFRNVIKARGGAVVDAPAAEAPAADPPAEAVTSPQDAPAPTEAPEAQPTPAEPPAPEPTAAEPPPAAAAPADLAIDPTAILFEFDRSSRGLQADQVVAELPASVAPLVDEVERAHDLAKGILRERLFAPGAPDDSVVAALRRAGLTPDDFDRVMAAFEAQGGRIVPDRMRVALVGAENASGPTAPAADDNRRSPNGRYTNGGEPIPTVVPQLSLLGVPGWPGSRDARNMDIAGKRAEVHPFSLWLEGARLPDGEPATAEWLAGAFSDERLAARLRGVSIESRGARNVDPRPKAFAWGTVKLPGAVPLVAPKAEDVLAAEPKGPVAPAWDPVELANPAGRREVVSKWEQGRAERDVLGMLAARLRAGEALSSEERALAGRVADRLLEHARVFTSRKLDDLEEVGLTAGQGWRSAGFPERDLLRPYPVGKDRPPGTALALLAFEPSGRSLTAIGRMVPFGGGPELSGINTDPGLLRALGMTAHAERMERVFDDARARWAELGAELETARRAIDHVPGRPSMASAAERREAVSKRREENRARLARLPEVRAKAAALRPSNHVFAPVMEVDRLRLWDEDASDHERAAAARRVADGERALQPARLTEAAAEILAAPARPSWTDGSAGRAVDAVSRFEEADRAIKEPWSPADVPAPRGIKDAPEVARARASLAGASSVSDRGVELPMRELAEFAKQASAKVGHSKSDHAVFDLPGGAAMALPISALRHAVETIRKMPDAQAYIEPSEKYRTPLLTFRWRNRSQPAGVLSGRLQLLPRVNDLPGRIASVRVGDPGPVAVSADMSRDDWLDALALARDGLLDVLPLHDAVPASYVPPVVLGSIVQLTTDRLAFPLALSVSPNAEDAPRWVQLAYCGTWKGHNAAKSGFTFDRGAFESMVKNFRADPRYDGGNTDVVAFDFNHASEMHPSQVADKGSPAQAWLQEMEVREGASGPELWGKVRYLPLAREYVRKGQYRFLSIAFSPNDRDLVSGKPIGPRVKSVAFTNDPFLRGLAPLVASADSPPVPTRDDEADMSTTIARLISVFALAATATEDDVIRAAEANVKELKDRRDVEAKQAVAVVCSAYGFDAERDAPTLLAAYTSDPEAFAKRYPVEGTRAAKRKLAPVVALEQRVVSGASRRAAPVTALGAGAAEDERDEDDLPAGFKLSAYPGRNATERCLAAVDADPAWKGRSYDERFERARVLKRAAERAGQC